MLIRYLCFLSTVMLQFSFLSAQVEIRHNQIGINTTNLSPNVSLHIKDDFEAIRLDGTSPWISFYNGLNYRGYLYMNSSDNMYLFNRTSNSLLFGTGNSTRMAINAIGNVGIGSTSPEVKLHVALGAVAGGNFNGNTIAGFERGNGNAYLNMLTTGSYESGLLFGDQDVAEQGGIIYNGGATPDGLQFRTNGNINRVAIDSQGDLGIGVTNPARPLHVKSRSSGNQWGIMIESVDGSLNWETSVFAGRYNWFYNGGTFPVSFITTDGTYSSSDRRLKQNIRPYKDVLPLIDRLEVATYQFRNADARDRRSLGLIAQDVAAVFPEIVQLSPGRDGEAFYAMDYSKIGVIALKAIQELQPQLQEDRAAKEALTTEMGGLRSENEALRKEMETVRSQNFALEKRLAAIETAMQTFEENCCSLPQRVLLDASDLPIEQRAFLGQNQPNPYSASTRISYFIPEATQRALLRIFTTDGKLIKEIIIEGNGPGELLLETQNLPAGVYVYSLMLDGSLFDSKQMVVKK